MKKIGIDLGTTYSTICFVDERYQPGAGEYLQPYRCGEDETAIASAVAYHIDDEASILVGEEALHKLSDDDPEYEVYQHFKMLLALEGTPALEAFIGEHPEYAVYRKRSPSTVTRDYFISLLTWYKQEQCLDEIERIVVTVPLVWMNFDQQANEKTGNAEKLLIQALEAACSKINSGGKRTKVMIRSEPEAAAGYFAYLHRHERKQEYNGDMLVVDYGGGTLDVTLAKVDMTEQGIHIASKFRSGKGRALDYALGVGGVAYDRALAQLALQQSQRELEGAELSGFLIALEKNKRLVAMRGRMNDFRLKGMDKLGMNPQGVKISPSLCDQAFAQVNKTPLNAALDEVFEDCPEIIKSPDALMVALVGGFSNLPFVEHVVRERFGINVDINDRNDPRFALSSTAQRSHAIAMGAALVANEKVTIADKLLYEIGVFLYSHEKDGPVYEAVLAYGSEYKKLQQVVWLPSTISGSGSLTLGLKASGRKDREPRRFSLKKLNDGKNRIGAGLGQKLVPDYDPDCIYRVGFSVPCDEEELSGQRELTIHFRNEDTGAEKSYPIGEVYLEFDNRVDKVG